MINRDEEWAIGFWQMAVMIRWMNLKKNNDGKKMKYVYVIAVLLGVILTAGCSKQGGIAREAVKDIEDIEIKGSDTLLQLVSNVAEAYSEIDSNARISVTGGGTGGGIVALINDEIDNVDASRKIKDSEIQQAKDHGIDPWEFIIARDMLSVIVHKDNPVAELTIGEIGKIYRGEITNWKELGGKDQEITLYGRQSTSGTYTFFMEHVLEGDYSPKMRNMEGNQAIIDAVKQDKSGMGYAGIGYLIDENGNQVSGIYSIKVAKDKNSEYISPLDKEKLPDYALSRPLYQYLAKKPVKNSAVYHFLMFELGAQGKDIIKKSGFDEPTVSDNEHNEELLSKI